MELKKSRLKLSGLLHTSLKLDLKKGPLLAHVGRRLIYMSLKGVRFQLQFWARMK